MQVALYSIVSVIAVSLISLIGVLTLSFISDFGRKFLTILVSFSVGALLGDVFIHLLPKLGESDALNLNSSLWILGAILFFFLIENMSTGITTIRWIKVAITLTPWFGPTCLVMACTT